MDILSLRSSPCVLSQVSYVSLLPYPYLFIGVRSPCSCYIFVYVNEEKNYDNAALFENSLMLVRYISIVHIDRTVCYEYYLLRVLTLE
jgi:hypothetical protein